LNPTQIYYIIFNIQNILFNFCDFFALFFDFPAGMAYIRGCKPKNLLLMPVHKVPGGYQWGQSGKIYPTKAQAERQGRAVYASGYREKTSQSKKK